MVLRENEQLIKVVRRHKSSLSGLWAASTGVILLFFLALLYFKFNFFGYAWQVFSVIALVLAFVILHKLYVWRHNVLFITNQRVIRNEQTGLFSKTVTEVLYQDIHEIVFNKKGFSAMMSNYGTLIIRTPSDNKVVFDKIPDPEKVVEIINKARSPHAHPQL